MAGRAEISQKKGSGVRCHLRYANRRAYGRCIRKGPAGRPSLFMRFGSAFWSQANLAEMGLEISSFETRTVSPSMVA